MYSSPKTTFFKEAKKTQVAKPILLLEDSGTAQVVVQKDAKIPAKPLPTTPAPKAVEEVKTIEPVVPKNVNEVKDIYATVSKVIKPAETKEIETAPKISVPPPSPQPKPSQERKLITAATLKEVAKSPKPQRISGIQDTTINKLEKPEGSPNLSGKYSPLLDRKLNNLKTKEPSGPREASPLALLKAAKEREKHRSGSVNENNVKNEPQSDLRLNSPQLTTKSASDLSLNSQDVQQESPKFESAVVLPSTSPNQQTQVHSQVPWTSLTSSKTLQEISPSVTKPVPAQPEVNKADWNVPKQLQANPQLPLTSLTSSKTVQSAMPSVSVPVEDSKVHLNVPFLPPPPEFDDFGDEEEPPPAMRPPNPPPKKIPPHSPPPVPPPPPPKVTPPPAPQLPPISDSTNQPIKLKPPPVLAKPKPTAAAPLPTPVSASQTTLLNILKKKMLEMDQKMGPVNEPEPSSDDWGTPLSDEDNKVPVVPKVTAQKKTEVNKSATLNMKELESKIAKKSSTKMPTIPTSNGSSRHQYGMTFTVRPGTKQPITLVSREEP